MSVTVDYPANRPAVTARHDRIARMMTEAGLEPRREVRGLIMVTTAAKGGVTIDVITPIWMDRDGWSDIRRIEDAPWVATIILDTVKAIEYASALANRPTPKAWGVEVAS